PPPHTSLLSFSFYDYDPHPELHSFPTRRSSDLFGSYAVQCMHFANSPKQRAEQTRQSKLATAAHHRALKFALFCQQLSQASSGRSEEHTSELQSRFDLVCRLLLEKKKHVKHNIL